MPARAEATAERVEFHLFSSLGLGVRTAIVAALFLVGALLQVMVAWWLGAPFVFYGVLLSLCKGVTNEPKVRGKTRWETVRVEELRKIEEMCGESRRWARDPFSLTAIINVGFGVFLLLLVAVAAVAWHFHARGQGNLRNAVAVDGGLMVLLLYATGRRRAWRPENIQIKLDPLLHIASYFERHPDPAVELRPMLGLKGTGQRSVPHDCRLMLKLKDAPEAFLGIQVQTSLNHVQGTPYPYMYCVLLAKRGSGLVQAAEPLLEPAAERVGFFSSKNDKKNPDLRKKRYLGEVAEPSVQSDVELVVIRQVTLRTGYHTKPDDQIRVMRTALHLAKHICANARSKRRRRATASAGRTAPSPATREVH